MQWDLDGATMGSRLVVVGTRGPTDRGLIHFRSVACSRRAASPVALPQPPTLALGKSVVAGGVYYALSTADQHVYQYSGGSWQDVQPYDAYSQIGVDSSGGLFTSRAIDHHVYHYTGGITWQDVQPYDAYSQIGVDSTASLTDSRSQPSGLPLHRRDYLAERAALRFLQPDRRGLDRCVYGLSAISHQVARLHRRDHLAERPAERCLQPDRYRCQRVALRPQALSHQVFRYTGGVNWTNVSPNATYSQIGIDAGGSLSGLSSARHQVFRFAGGSNWTSVSPAAPTVKSESMRSGHSTGSTPPPLRCSATPAGSTGPTCRLTTPTARSPWTRPAIIALSKISHTVARYSGG